LYYKEIIMGSILDGVGITFSDGTKQTTAYIVPTVTTGGTIGVGQTWADVTESRSPEVTYTNSTGKPIMVNVFSSAIDSGFALTATVDSVTVAYGGGGGGGDARRTGFASFIVPNLSTYSVKYFGAYTGSTLKWAELR
jgi:hypothetical protein